MGQCPMYIPSNDDEYHDQALISANKKGLMAKLSRSEQFSPSPSQNSIPELHTVSTSTTATLATLSNSSCSNDDDDEGHDAFTSLPQTNNNLVAAYYCERTTESFNEQLKQQKEDMDQKIVVDLSQIKVHNDDHNTKILFNVDESLVEVCATRDDQRSTIASTIDDNSCVTKLSIATLKMSNTRCPNINNPHRSKNQCNSNVPPTLEEKETFDSTKDEPLFLLKPIPEDTAEGGILHLTMKANVYDFYQNKYLRMFPNTSSGTKSNNTYKKTSSKENNDKRRSINLQNDCKSSFLDLCVDGSLNIYKLLKENKKKKNHKNSSFQPSINDSSSITIYTQDENNNSKPIAICNVISIMDSTIVVRIYSISKPRFEGQHPASIPNMTDDNNHYYPWADISIDGEFPLPIKYSIYFHNHNGCITLCNRHNMNQKTPPPQYKGSHVDIGSLTIQVLGQNNDNDSDQFESTTAPNYYSLCFLLSLLEQDSDRNSKDLFCMTMSKHVDPILFICFTAIIDEVLESMMKRQFFAMLRQKKNKVLRSSFV